jgi:alginate O-acetyltransferase complex protein AlgI
LNARAISLLFTEPTFLFLFLPLLLLLYFLPWHANRLRPGFIASCRNWLLLAASLIFYAKGGGSFTWLILGLIAFNYFAALEIDRRRDTIAARWLLRGAVTIDLVVLATFKYANFIVDNLNVALSGVGIAAIQIPPVLLPIGISFFTFHAISYVVDVHRKDAVAQKGPVEAALYLLLFPQLIAGPIIRYREIASQLKSRVITSVDFAFGIRRFIIGLAKKMLVANIVAAPADRLFAMPANELSAAHAWLAVVCYTLQIYFDFSGYSDMAIGLGRMFGFRFPENFRYPYIASSVQDFWRRWHISLSSWFRDYVYIPLGGNRRGTVSMYVNLVTVFFLCGLWHGAAWTFVVWGLFHGAFLVIERVGVADWLQRVPSAVRHTYTLLVVMVGWVFFRADSIGGATAILRAMVGLGPADPTAYTLSWYLTPELILALIAGAIGATPIVPALERLLTSLRLVDRGGPVDPPGALGLGWLPSAAATVALVVLLAASFMLMAARTYNPFIYFRF